MTIAIEVNFSAEEWERTLKWYSLAAKDKHLSKIDELLYNKIKIIALSEREEEKIESDDQ